MAWCRTSPNRWPITNTYIALCTPPKRKYFSEKAVTATKFMTMSTTSTTRSKGYMLTRCSVVLCCVLALTGKIYISILSWFKTVYMEILNYVKQKQIWYTRGWLDSFKYNSCVCEFAASHLQIYLLIQGMHIVTFWWTYVSSFLRWFFFYKYTSHNQNEKYVFYPCALLLIETGCWVPILTITTVNLGQSYQCQCSNPEEYG